MKSPTTCAITSASLYAAISAMTRNDSPVGIAAIFPFLVEMRKGYRDSAIIVSPRWSAAGDARGRGALVRCARDPRAAAHRRREGGARVARGAAARVAARLGAQAQAALPGDAARAPRRAAAGDRAVGARQGAADRRVP